MRGPGCSDGAARLCARGHRGGPQDRRRRERERDRRPAQGDPEQACRHWAQVRASNIFQTLVLSKYQGYFNIYKLLIRVYNIKQYKFKSFV